MAGTKTLSIVLPISFLALACIPEERLVTELGGSLAVEDLTVLDVVVGAGDIRVEGQEGLAEISVEVRIYTQFSSCDQDEEVLADMDFELYANDDGEARLWVDMDDEWGGYWADVVVLLPTEMALELRDTTGDIDVSDVASLELDDGTGDANIERVLGDVEIEDGSGDLHIEHVGGSVQLNDDTGDIDILDVAGAVEVVDGSGDLWLEEVWSSVRIEDGTGDMDLRFIDGAAIIEDGSGDIDVRDVTGVVRIHDGSGDIHAEQVGDLEVIEDGGGEVDWD